ncbi:hypothetical protein EVAR_11626_1 [Eumeta japonica]|uniref:Uncharacterized protein n=1 Tax=Eumeta variegata TaxID=151549 RepID=A0A4C1WXT3_EUMVA|nr:hypothetical protein EVAR_11626_1 [Eumeta japonica]
MKDASKRFFDIAGSHPNALLRAAVDYQPPPPTHFIRRPRNVLFDPPDALTAAIIDLSSPHPTHPAAADRSRPGGRNGNRPVTVSSDAYAEMTPLRSRRACHAPSALTRAVRPRSVKL